MTVLHFCTSHEYTSLAEFKPYPEPSGQENGRNVAVSLPAPVMQGEYRRGWYEYWLTKGVSKVCPSAKGRRGSQVEIFTGRGRVTFVSEKF